MDFKKIILITLLLLSVLTIGAVSAVDNNLTDNLEETQINEEITIGDTNENLQQTNSDNNLEVHSSNYEKDKLSAPVIKDEFNIIDKTAEVTELKQSQNYEYSNYEDSSSYDYDENYKLETYFTVDAKLKVNHKSNSYFGVYLYDDDWGDVAYKKIILKIWTGKKAKQYVLKTDKFGYAEFNTKNLKLGTHKVKITFKGSEDYYGCSEYSKIIVQKPKLTIKAPKVTKKYKKSGKFKIKVKADIDSLKGIKLKVKVKTNGKYKTYKVKTNYKGIAYLSTKNLKVGKHKVIITPASSKFKGKAYSWIKIKKPAVKKKTKRSSSNSYSSSSGSSDYGGGYYVASANSNKFHYPDCGYVKNIRSYNKITFSSRSQAVNAGYSSCSRCNP